MLKNILKEISSKINYYSLNRDRGYEYFCKVVVNDNSVRGILCAEDVHKILKKLNLTSKDIICKSFEKDYFNSIEFILKIEEYSSDLIGYGFIEAAKLGHIDTMKNLLALVKDQFNKDDIIHAIKDEAFLVAASNGHLAILKYIIELAKDPIYRGEMSRRNAYYPFISASRGGYIEILNYLIELFQNPTDRDTMIQANIAMAYQNAAKHGHIKVMKYLSELTQQNGRKYIIRTFGAFSNAARNGHIEIMKYLLVSIEDPDAKYRMIHEEDDRAFKNAAEHGHIEVMDYLLDLTQDPIDRNIMIHASNDGPFICAARSGKIDVMKYLLELTQKPKAIKTMIHADYNDAFRSAASNGHVEVLKYLVELTQNPRDWKKMVYKDNIQAFNSAAIYSHIEVMKYLVELTQDPEAFILSHECEAVSWAVRSGNCEVMKYILEITQNPDVRKIMIHSKSRIDSAIANKDVGEHLTKFLICLDPFYNWLDSNRYHVVNHPEFEILKHYCNINIMALKNIVITSKELFSEKSVIRSEDNSFNIIDLPNKLHLVILRKLTQVSEDHYLELDAAIKAFTYDSCNYSGGFIGFTQRYEEALKELGAIDFEE